MNKVMFHYYIEPEIIPNLLTEDEIEYIKRESMNKFTMSVIGGNRGQEFVDSTYRMSESAWLESSDPIINNLMRKCCSRLKRSIGHCEDLQVVRYKSGGFYKQHQDCMNLYQNPRMYTFIMALNDDYEGGETSFSNLDIKFKLKKGDCLFFHTLDNYEDFTSLALHGGQPVKSGEKWICNLWVHKHPYN